MFTYTPLKENSDEVRFVDLHPASDFDADIELTLYSTPLKNAPKYLALSYTWDAPHNNLPPEWNSPEATHPVSVNGQSFQIRYNLESALRHIRAIRPEKTTFWIDAICIDQSDLSERSAQVLRMPEIYAGAEDTVVWLGPKIEGSDRAMDVIFGVWAHVETRLLKGRSLYHQRQYGYPIEGLREELEMEIGNDVQAWIGVSRILTRAWWNRAWTLQEATLSSTIFVLCGLKLVEWQTIQRICFLLRELASDESYIPEFMVDVMGTVALKAGVADRRMGYSRYYHNDEREPSTLFWETMSILRASDCLDPKDKIYATLGILGSTLRISPDYRKSVKSVYKDFTRSVIERDRNLSIFGYCILQDHGDLPSWVPDWRKRSHGAPLLKADDSTYGAVYKAGKDTNLVFSFSQDSLSISLKGVIVDSLEVLGDPISETTPLLSLTYEQHNDQAANFTDMSSKLWRQLKQWLRIANAYGQGLTELMQQVRIQEGSIQEGPIGHEVILYPHSDESLKRAFQRTLSVDVKMKNDESFDCRLGDNFVPWEELDMSDNAVAKALMWAVTGRVFFISKSGYIGLVREEARKDDQICIFQGSEVPHVIRPDSEGAFRLVGECYVHGIMDGECFDGKEDVKWYDIKIC